MKSPDLLKSEAPGVAKTNGELPAATGLQLQGGCEKSHFPDKVHITSTDCILLNWRERTPRTEKGPFTPCPIAPTDP
ncbi:unnamed protein product [Prunus armeniaca]